MDPTGKVALVTGGARRVGRAISLALARAGAHVIVNYRESAQEAAETVDIVQESGGHAIAVQADISSKKDIDALVHEAHRALGRLDILVNSASLFESAPFDAISEADWDRVLGVNLRGPFLLSQAAAPLLRANGGGVIVNIADLSALQPWPSFAHHSVSKAGLVHLTRILARVLAPDVRANCVAPGTVLPPEGYQGEDNAWGRDRRTVARAGTPDDVVDALLYLVRSDFITGQTLVVDGGRMLL
jgi:NAD(P)-dependent dehydrogenase (short-subunit alcohol dehydrogenase family)